MRPTLFTSNFGKFDSINSTYRHEIYLANGKVLVGYSKGLNLPELADKDSLFQKVCVRLLRNGYLHPKSVGKSRETACIAFYKNDPIDPDLIVVLYPGKYELATDQLDNKLLISFLDRFYENLTSGTERMNLVKEPRKSDHMSLDLKFDTIQQAFEHAQKLINKYGVAPGLAKRWYSEWLGRNRDKYNK